MTLSRFGTVFLDARCLLADGAMGSALIDQGLAIGTAPELWLLQHPERVATVHQAYIAAGCDIILTNSFGANRRRLALCGAADHVHDLNITAARLARDAVAADSTRRVFVAGAVGPLWDANAEHVAEDIFVEQMQALAVGGVDLIWIETMTDFGEMHAAARAAARIGLPYVITASFDRDGRTHAGPSTTDVAHVFAAFDPPPLAMGCNCGVGPAATLVALNAMHVAAPQAVLVAKSNAGLPKVVEGKAIHPVTPDGMATYALACRDSGVRIIGGCCGTTPAHLAAMRVALDRGN